MAREFASIRVKIWQDDDFRSLPRDAQHLYFTLLTIPGLSYAGVLDWRPRKFAAFASDWTPKLIDRASEILREKIYLIVDEDTEEALIRTFIRNDEVLKQPRLAISMVNAYGSVGSRKLQGVITHELIRLHKDQPDLKGWHRREVTDLLAGKALDPRQFGANGVAFGATGNHVLHATATATEQHAPDAEPTAQRPRVQPPTYPSDFVAFWQVYPKKHGKDAALRAWRAAIKRASVEEIMLGVKRYVARPDRQAKPQFTKDPATWLNGGHWGDEETGTERLTFGGGDTPAWEM